ncbi:hypothetical protein D1AOALGA4SA_6466 [Olavius algarvensis Delta 1 endosymbiont]|nr:hypothetical protein D1AOALGA4SA_6466 [Olavius algarvensis Delta 1 endosymbiont]
MKIEYCEYKADDGLILQTDPCHPYTIRSRCTKPSPPPADLRHSNIPSFRPRLQQIHGIAD